MNRRTRRTEQPVEHGHALGRIPQINQYRHKLVAADARQGISFTQGVLHADGQRHQQLVTRLMPMGIVHHLETVKVQKHDRQPLCTPLSLKHGLLQPVGQQHAVWQVGQCVEVCDALKLLLMLLGFSDV